jgi:hypothetical protein
MAMFSSELQEISPLKLGHGIKLVGIQVPEVELGNGRGGGRRGKFLMGIFFLTVGGLLITSGWIAIAGPHFVGLNKSLREALTKSLIDNQKE